MNNLTKQGVLTDRELEIAERVLELFASCNIDDSVAMKILAVTFDCYCKANRDNIK